jgi:hypothetical protein
MAYDLLINGLLNWEAHSKLGSKSISKKGPFLGGLSNLLKLAGNVDF